MKAVKTNSVKHSKNRLSPKKGSTHLTKYLFQVSNEFSELATPTTPSFTTSHFFKRFLYCLNCMTKHDQLAHGCRFQRKYYLDILIFVCNLFGLFSFASNIFPQRLNMHVMHAKTFNMYIFLMKMKIIDIIENHLNSF